MRFKLHEDEIPEFEKTVAFATDGAFRFSATDAGPLVDDNFGAGAARAHIAHLPEIVFRRKKPDPFRGKIAFPEFPGFLIGSDPKPGIPLMDGGIELFRREAEDRGQEFPAHGDRAFLEVIAKGEVSQHFEKSMVAGGVAHVLQVVVFSSGPHAFLGGCGPGIKGFFLAGEIIFELVHARVGKEQGRVLMRDQGGTAHNRMSVLLEVFQELPAHFVSCHHSSNQPPAL